LNLGFEPNVLVAGDPTSYSLTLWLYAGYKLNAAADTQSTTVYLHQSRLGVGVEASIGDMSPSDKPLTISVEAARLHFNSSSYGRVFGKTVSSIAELSITAILPVFKEAGVLAEFIGANQNLPSTWRIGLILGSSKLEPSAAETGP
jgi:hypothetical protein